MTIDTKKRSLRCPGCGAGVVLDESTLLIKHEGTVCSTFFAIMNRAGMKTEQLTWAEVVNPDGTVVKAGDA